MDRSYLKLKFLHKLSFRNFQFLLKTLSWGKLLKGNKDLNFDGYFLGWAWCLKVKMSFKSKDIVWIILVFLLVFFNRKQQIWDFGCCLPYFAEHLQRLSLYFFLWREMSIEFWIWYERYVNLVKVNYKRMWYYFLKMEYSVKDIKYIKFS